MRVLVCGGRYFGRANPDTPPAEWEAEMARNKREREVMKSTLAQLRGKGLSLIIHGGAPGADAFAGQWAGWNDIPTQVFHADWRRFGKSAGPRRNRSMLHVSCPHLVVAFPGGAGTQDMVRVAEAAGVEVMRVPG